MVLELGPTVSKSSTRISKVCVPTDSEHKFNKTGVEICYPQDSVWGCFDWEPAFITFKR